MSSDWSRLIDDAPTPPGAPVDQQQQQVGEECERGEDCYQGRDQAQAPNEITDRPVKPSSAGIPLSFLGSDTVVTDKRRYLPTSSRRRAAGGW